MQKNSGIHDGKNIHVPIWYMVCSNMSLKFHGEN